MVSKEVYFFLQDDVLQSLSPAIRQHLLNRVKCYPSINTLGLFSQDFENDCETLIQKLEEMEKK